MDTKVCSKCGEAKPTSMFGSRSENKNWKRSSCRACRSLSERGSRDSQRAATRRYQAKNPEMKKKRLESWISENPEKFRAIRSRANKRYIESLPDAYVIKTIFRIDPPSDVPPDLIEAKRVHLQIHRLLRDMTK